MTCAADSVWQLEEGRELGGMSALVEQVAADDEIEAAEIGIRTRPRRLMERDRRQAVQRRVEAQELLGQRVMIARRDVGAAALQHEAAETETAADLEDALAGDSEPTHLLGERDARRPEEPEERPGRR